MRVAIINLTAGGISGGYLKYLLNITPRLIANQHVSEVLCAAPESIKLSNYFSDLHKLQLVYCKPYRFFQYDYQLYSELKMFSPDVILLPVEKAFTYKGAPVVSMLQNMEPMVCIKNNSITLKAKSWLKHKHAKNAIKQSDRTIAISNYVKNYMLHSWNIPAKKIGLVYHGIDPVLSNDNWQRPASIPNIMGDRFIFTAGSIRPARGLEDLIYSLKKVIDVNNNKSTGLVIAGHVEPSMLGYKKRLMRIALKEKVNQSICWVDELAEDEMSWCYQNCRLFVMTSRVEACPNIALEAMAHGCVIVSSDNPPLPEVFCDTAIYYEANNHHDLAGKLNNVLAWNDKKRTTFTVNALKRASIFSWDTTVEKTVNELRKAVNVFNCNS